MDAIDPAADIRRQLQDPAPRAPVREPVREMLHALSRDSEILIDDLFVIPALLSGLAMVLLIATGLIDILWTCGTLLGAAWWGQEIHVLPRFFRGLDALILAPVAYVLILGIRRYLKSERAGAENPSGHSTLVPIKALIVGLMAAAVAVHLVEMMLAQDPVRPQVSGRPILSFCLVIGVLGMYSVFLEVVALVERRRAGDPQGAGRAASSGMGEPSTLAAP